MAEETIDYKALFEGVQQENERLRLSLLKARNASQVSFNWHAVKSFLEEHYTAILVAVLIVYYMGHLLIDTLAMFWGKRP